MQVPILQFILLTEKDVAEEELQIFRSMCNTGRQIIIIGTNQSVTEVPFKGDVCVRFGAVCIVIAVIAGGGGWTMIRFANDLI